MKKLALLFLCLVLASPLWAGNRQDAREILEKVDANTNVESQILVTSMIIHRLRGSKEIKFKTWVIGKSKSFSVTLAPAREKGQKFLKMNKNLWIYTPRADRTIKIAGHMLRQSVMGSDLSYEDMLEQGKLVDDYDAVIEGETQLRRRPVWILVLKAKTPDVAYQSIKLWIDRERFIALREELFAASGKLLKRLDVLEVFQTSRGWYTKKALFKDMLKRGKGTEYIVHGVDLDAKIPSSRFSKAALRRR